MRRIASLLCLLLIATTMCAMPAKRGQWRTIVLGSGEQVSVQLVGDENGHHWEAADGRLFTGNGHTAFREATAAELQAHRSQRALLRQQARRQRMERRQAAARAAGRQAPLREFGVPTSYRGTKRGIIILVEFSDLSFDDGHDAALYNDIANTEGYSDGYFTGSVHDYFHAQSNGQFDLIFDVVGPVKLPKSYSYYGANDSNGDDKHIGEFAQEAVKLADELADFGLYDWDGDGEVDQVFLVYAGKGEANGGDYSTIWPHEWDLASAGATETGVGPLVVDDHIVNTYACGAELSGSTLLDGIGTICHEFSHCLGLPDFYDTKGSNFGMSSWSLMDTGCYNNDGFTPCNYTAYERWFCGWQTPTELHNGDKIRGVAPLSDYGETFILRNDNNDNEYFLFENHAKKGWDAHCPSEGMLVIHVDYDKDVWQANTVNNTTDHQRCTILPADNRASRYYPVGDTYPYKDNNTISDTSKPAFKLYNKNSEGTFTLGYTLSNIALNDDGTLQFDVKGGDGDDPLEPVAGVYLHETFDQCDGKGGNDGLWSGSIANAAFKPDVEGWETVALNAAKGASQCAKFGTTGSPGMVNAPAMNINGEAKLTFKAAPWGDEFCSLVIFVNDQPVESFSLTNNQWTDCELTLTGSGSTIITFQPTKNRFFLDEVKVEGVETSAIVNVNDNGNGNGNWNWNGNGNANANWNANGNGDIYDLQGRRIDKDAALRHGIYIVGGKKVIR